MSEVYILLQIVDKGYSATGWSVEQTKIIGVFTTRDAAFARLKDWPGVSARVEAHIVNAD